MKVFLILIIYLLQTCGPYYQHAAQSNNTRAQKMVSSSAFQNVFAHEQHW